LDLTASSQESSVTTPPGPDDIDVVIPVYNGVSHIRDCIASVLSQTRKPRLIIVVDDGSTDETAAVVGSLQRDHSSLFFHRMGRNVGVSAARNVGISLSDAPFIAFIDADDVWLPNKLDLQLQIFKGGEQSIGLVHSSFFLIDESDNILPHKDGLPPLLRGNVFSRLLREGNILSGSASSVLIKRDVLDKSGVFDEQLYYGEDWDLWLRLAAIWEVGHTPEAVVGIRVRQDGLPHHGSNSAERFLQSIRVYSRWEDSIRGDRAFICRIRRDGFRALLMGARSLLDVNVFYSTLRASDQAFIRSLYASRSDFWSGLLTTAAALACKLIARLALKMLPTRRAGVVKMPIRRSPCG
jgi:glycosyltransferase involved in cell wall biosynthesis